MAQAHARGWYIPPAGEIAGPYGVWGAGAGVAGLWLQSQASKQARAINDLIAFVRPQRRRDRYAIFRPKLFLNVGPSYSATPGQARIRTPPSGIKIPGLIYCVTIFSDCLQQTANRSTIIRQKNLKTKFSDFTITV